MQWTAWFGTLVVCVGCGAGPAITASHVGADGGDDDPLDGGAHVRPDAWIEGFSVADAGRPVEGPACQRTVNLRAVTISSPVPFDVVIVADNSDSLSWS